MSYRNPTQSKPRNEDWERFDSSTHDITELRNLLSRFTNETEDMSEIAFEGDRPIVVKRTESKDIVVEVSATYKSGATSLQKGQKEATSIDGKTKAELLKSLFDEVDSPAVTTEEVANYLNCTTKEAIQYLIEFDHRGWIDHRQSGDTTLWWQVNQDSEPDDLDDIEQLPKYIREGLKKSKRDIKEWVENNQKDGESLKETYRRIRGNPSSGEVRELLQSDEKKSNDGEMTELIKQKRESSKNRKRELQELFK